jgi:hypothetical protein
MPFSTYTEANFIDHFPAMLKLTFFHAASSHAMLTFEPRPFPEVVKLTFLTTPLFAMLKRTSFTTPISSHAETDFIYVTPPPFTTQP